LVILTLAFFSERLAGLLAEVGMKALLLSFCVVLYLPVFGQTGPQSAQSQPPSYSNYSIMLVNPAIGGGAVVLMHNPKNELEFVPVNSTNQALSAGYVAVRAVELGEFISTLKEEVSRLSAENARLQNQPAHAAFTLPVPAAPSQADLQAQQRAQAAAEKAARRQQMIQAWLMLRGVQPQTQNLNVQVTNCNQFPAMCTGR
jgi:hypothetical protein